MVGRGEIVAAGPQHRLGPNLRLREVIAQVLLEREQGIVDRQQDCSVLDMDAGRWKRDAGRHDSELLSVGPVGGSTYPRVTSNSRTIRWNSTVDQRLTCLSRL